MPTIEQNYSAWNSSYLWTKAGDEWSDPWGSARNQWYTLLLPRIHHYLPARHILEIAPGHGRWTQFLLQHTESLSVIDLSENCIAKCKERFADHKHIKYYVNNGKTLQGIEDNSVDFVFSFDSLVHAEYDVICKYLQEIQRVLCPGGSAVIHHSNLAAVKKRAQAPVRRRIVKYLKMIGITKKRALSHWRASSVSAELVLAASNKLRFQCTGQEVFKWVATQDMTDCISIFWKGEWVGNNGRRRFENVLFQADVEKSLELMCCYRKPEEHILTPDQFAQ